MTGGEVRNDIMRKIIILITVSVISVLIYFLIPVLVRQIPAMQHFVISYYLSLLRHTILFIPLAVIIYLITPLRKFLDYERYIIKPKQWQFLAMIFVLAMAATIFISWR